MPTPVCLEAQSTLSVHTPVSSGQVSSCGISAMKSARLAHSLKVSAYTGCHTRLTPLPSGPFSRTDQVCELCPGVEDRLVLQQDEPRSMGGVFGQLSGGLRQPVRGGYIWFPRRLGIF